MNINKALFAITLGVLMISCTESQQELSSNSNTQLLAVADTENIQKQALETEKTPPATLSFTAVGDMMLGTNYPSKNYLPPMDGKTLLDSMKPFLKDADVTFGNLEGCLLTKGGHPKRCNDPSKCYAFRMPEHYANYLVDAGFDVVSIANNHMGDFGEPGRTNTKKVLKDLGIHAAGLLSQPTAVWQVKGVTIGMAAFAPNSGTCNFRNIKKAVATVKALDSICDIVIVSFHGGAEGSKHQHVTRKTERFYGEDRGNPYKFSHAVIDAGADMVFGHGPHVTRAMEIYKDRVIAYSLGNFATYARFNLRGANGIAPILSFETDLEGKFISGKIIPTYQKGEGIPLYDKKKRVIQKLNELIKADFPESTLRIGEDGSIKP